MAGSISSAITATGHRTMWSWSGLNMCTATCSRIRQPPPSARGAGAGAGAGKGTGWGAPAGFCGHNLAVHRTQQQHQTHGPIHVTGAGRRHLRVEQHGCYCREQSTTPQHRNFVRAALFVFTYSSKKCKSTNDKWCAYFAWSREPG